MNVIDPNGKLIATIEHPKQPTPWWWYTWVDVLAGLMIALFVGMVTLV